MFFWRTSFLVFLVTALYIGSWLTIRSFKWRRMLKMGKNNHNFESLDQSGINRLEGIKDFSTKTMYIGNRFREVRDIENNKNNTAINATATFETMTNATLSETTISETDLSDKNITTDATIVSEAVENATLSETTIYETTTDATSSLTTINETIFPETTINETISPEMSTNDSLIPSTVPPTNIASTAISQTLLNKLERFFSIFRDYIMNTLYQALQLELKTRKIRERIMQILMKKVAKRDLNNAVATVEKSIKEAIDNALVKFANALEEDVQNTFIDLKEDNIK